MHSLSAEMLMLMSAIAALIIGALLRQLQPWLKLPYSVLLLLLGLGLGLMEKHQQFSHTAPLVSDLLNYVSTLDPHLILFLFLPILIFQSAFSMEAHLFKRMFSQISLLALPGLIIASLLTATAAYFLFPWSWSWGVAMLFGVLISATDPIAVVALLKEQAPRKRLETLLEGESLLNDGTAIVLFALFFNLLSLGVDYTPMQTILSFVRTVLGGTLVGLLVGWCFLKWVVHLYRDPLAQISLTIASAYFSFFLAENLLQVSGIVALVALGIYMGTSCQTLLQQKVIDFLKVFWELMAHIANTCIFILVGIIIATKVSFASELNLVWLLVAYLLVLFSRAIMLLIIYPLLKRSPVGFSLPKAWVLFWGGLRGAIALALALTLIQSDQIEPEPAQQILFLAAGIVVLTTVINGSSMGWLFHKLKLDQLPPSKQAAFERAVELVDQRLHEKQPEVQEHELLRQADWEQIEQRLQKSSPLHHEHQTGFCLIEDKPDLGMAFRRQLLEAEKQNYWRQFRSGFIGQTAFSRLLKTVEEALDGAPKLDHHQLLLVYWKIPVLLHTLGKWPMLGGWVRHRSFSNLMLMYDIARGFIHAQNELLEMAPSLAPNQKEQQAAVTALVENQRQILSRIEQLRDNFPNLVYSLESNAACRVMLVKRAEIIDKLLHEGILEEPEARKLKQDNERSLNQLHQNPLFLPQPPVAQSLAKLPLLKELSAETLQYLSTISQFQLYGEGEVILQQEDKGGDLLLITKGRVKTRLRPKEGSEEISTLGCGQLLCPGAILSGYCEYSAKSIMPVELLCISHDKLQRLMKEDKLVFELLKSRL